MKYDPNFLLLLPGITCLRAGLRNWRAVLARDSQPNYRMHCAYASAVHWDVLSERAEFRFLCVHPSPISDMALSRTLPSTISSHVPQLQPGGGSSSKLFFSSNFVKEKSSLSTHLYIDTQGQRLLQY